MSVIESVNGAAIVDPTSIDKSGEVRKLSRTDLQAQIDAAIARLNPNSHFGVIGYADEKGAYGAIVARGPVLGGQWSVSFAGKRWWNGQTEVYGEVAFQC